MGTSYEKASKSFITPADQQTKRMKLKKKKIINVLIPSIITLIVGVLAIIIAYFRISSRTLPAAFRKPHIVGHNGAGDTFPEDVMWSLEKATFLGASIVEVDIQITKDEQLAVIHDATIDRTTNGTGLVSSYTMAELQMLDAAYHWPEYKGKGFNVPSLIEVVEWLRLPHHQNILLIIDIKTNSTSQVVQKTLEVFKQYPFLYQRAVVISFEPHILYQIRRADPSISTSFITMRNIISSGCNVNLLPSWLCKFPNIPLLDAVTLKLSQTVVPWFIGAGGLVIRSDSVTYAEVRDWIEHNWWVDVFDAKSSKQIEHLLQLGASVAPKILPVGANKAK